MANCWFCYQEAGEGGYHEKCSKNFFGTTNIPMLELNNKMLTDLANETINKRIAITGMQPKLSVSLNKNKENSRLTIVGLWGEFILKPQHSVFSYMPETEDLTMHLASLFGITVCAHTLLKATDGNLVYLAKRFDRDKGKKIHMEDFCQLSGFLTENKYKSSYEKIGKLVLKYCTNTGLDALDYFELVLFSYLSGNNDMHLKNFSVLHLGEQIKLSPAYDLLNVNLINPKDHEEMALTLNGKKNKIKLSDFTEFAAGLRIPQKAIESSLKKFSAMNEQVDSLISSSFLNEEKKEMYWHIWMSKQKIFSTQI